MELEKTDLFHVEYYPQCLLYPRAQLKLRVWFSKSMSGSSVLGTEDAQIRQLASDSWTSYVVGERKKQKLRWSPYNSRVKDKGEAMPNSTWGQGTLH